MLNGVSKVINLFPHPENVMIFESNSDFCDNPRALFDYMVDVGLNKQYEMVWIVKEMSAVDRFQERYENVRFIQHSRPALSKDFFKQIYYYSIAKYAFYSHAFIGIPGNKKQTRMFMTHGSLPLKNTTNRYWSYKRNTDILATSEYAAFYNCVTFVGGNDRIRILGHPRNDKLFDENDNIKSVLGLKEYDKIIIWMPTFKHHKSGGRSDFSDSSDSDISLLTTENMIRINECLSKYNACLILKFHPAQNMDFVQNVNLSNICTISNQQLLERDIPLYSLIGCCDALLTDYSSVYFDYLLLDRPIGFELADIDNYESGIGFTLQNPLDYMPGEKIYNIDGILSFIRNVISGIDDYSTEREKLCNLIHKNKDNHSSKRVVEFLKIE